MAKKFYVVWAGRTPGIYTDWQTCKQQIDKFSGARYKSFPTAVEAKQAFSGTGSKSVASKSSGASKAGAKPKRANNSPKTHTAADIKKMSVDIKLFTDGGCNPNPGKAGSGMAVYHCINGDDTLTELWYGLFDPKGTNNTAELHAFHEALKFAAQEIANKKTVIIFCDSKYSIQCITQWAINWEKKGWTKAGGEIKNLTLIQQMYRLHQHIKNDVQVLHVNGHVGVEGNELADRMSIETIARKEKAWLQYDSLDIPTILALEAG